MFAIRIISGLMVILFKREDNIKFGTNTVQMVLLYDRTSVQLMNLTLKLW